MVRFCGLVSLVMVVSMGLGAARGATAPKPPASAAAGLTASLVASKDSYVLDLSQSGKAFRDKLAELGKAHGAMPPTPAVDLVLQLKNNSDKDLKILVGGDSSIIELKLEGPAAGGAVTVQNTVMMTMDYKIGTPVTIGAGKTYDIKISSLSFGARGISQGAYWTEVGEYKLSATFTSHGDGAGNEGQVTKVTGGPVVLKVVRTLEK